MLRNTQFREDAGPTAHPVKPSEYQAIDNFYTTTIYEKGAELIRMLHTLLGSKRFMRGMATYVSRFDGTAATTEDFVQAIADGACANGETLGFDLEQFKRWYHQAGTPQLTVERSWEASSGRLTLQLRQQTPPTPEQPVKQPLVLPIAMALIGSTGRQGEERLLVFDQEEQVIEIGAVPGPQPPALSILRRFSAPVTLQMEMTLEETLQLLAADDDPFSRWEELVRDCSGRSCWHRAAAEPDATVESALIHALRRASLTWMSNKDPNWRCCCPSPGWRNLRPAKNPWILWRCLTQCKIGARCSVVS